MPRNLADWSRALREHDKTNATKIRANELILDKIAVYKRLVELELPHPENLFVDGAEYNEIAVREFLERYPNCFCRLIPKSGEEKRPYKDRIADFTDFNNFITNTEKVPLPLEYYVINLVEKHDVIYTGSIVSNPDSPTYPIVTELVRGTGEDLFHGLKTPISAYVDHLGVIRYRNIPEGEFPNERRLVKQALKYIGWPKFPYPGYYEYDVWAEGNLYKIRFRTYTSQKPFTLI